MVYLCLLLTVTLFVYGLLLLKYEKKERVQKRLDFFLIGEQVPLNTAPDAAAPSFFIRFVKPLFSELKRGFKRKMPGEKEAKIEKKLLMAGSPFGMAPVDFRLLQVVLLILFPILSGTYGLLLKAGNGAVAAAIFIGFILGLACPQLYLKNKTKTRSRLALRELPDILDLLMVCLEAGLGFDGAVAKVVSKKEGILSGEFHRCLEEIRLGKTRREALTGIKERLDVDEIKAFISNVLQAEKLGIGMVQVLRIQSYEVREKRKQRAEEAAMKAPIKMLFPLVLFIFPSLFIVLLGPAILQFIETFKNM